MESEIDEYENQLKQVKLAIASLADGPEKQNLIALEADLTELIALSKNDQKSGQSSKESTSENDKFFEEYNLFKAELAEIDKAETKGKIVAKSTCEKLEGASLQKELSELQGTKCQAPFMYKWADDVNFHNAFICQVPCPGDVHEYDNIEVKVMFINPTHKEMLPCPYYLEGNCRFTDEKCHYSHGEVVLLSALKEFREPVFTELSAGSKVLAKQNDSLWHRAVIISITEEMCHVKFESSSKEDSIPLHNIYPLESNTEANEEFHSDSESSDYNDETNSKHVHTDNEDDIVKRVLENPPGTALGEWEKFTKGFGSKLMAKMGYIHGSGLGKGGLGRVDPVPVVILPPGKSLDHCMMLKSRAGNDRDLFKAERKMKKQQRKHEAHLKKAYENEKNKGDIFKFLNEKLHRGHNKEGSSKTDMKKALKNESTRNLNVTSLQLSEEARKIEREIKSLNQSLMRHSPNSAAFNIIKEKLTTKKNSLSMLHASERKIKNEQNLRNDRRKLTVF